MRARNIIDCGCDSADIKVAIRRALEPAFRASLDDLVSPFGDGGASPRIADRLAGQAIDDLLCAKRFHQLDRAAV